jgi:DNA uptake protein ComE-like DNA-binding protein
MKRIAGSLVALSLAFGLVSAARADDTPPAATTAPATTATPTTTAKSTSTHHSSSAHHTSKVDINSASKEQLMKLSGVTDETAEKIIAARPYKSTSELVSKSVVTKNEYSKIKNHVTAKKAA